MNRKELSPSPSTAAAVRRIHRATALVTFTAAVFCLFFEAAKGAPFRAINPFGDDPYDAVGSIAIQIAFVCSALTYARALRLRDDPSRTGLARFILRGNILVLCSVFATVAADAAALFLHPVPASYYGRVLEAGLALVFALAALSAIALRAVFPRVDAAAPSGFGLADGIDDLLTLVRVPLKMARGIAPRPWVERLEIFDSENLFARLPWLSPGVHPWRFVCALGTLVGFGLILAEAREGPPPDVATGLLVAAIFVSVELTATVLGFALLGRYLGLRRSDR